MSKMKEIAEGHLGHSVTDAIVTVPVSFDASFTPSTLV